MSDAPIYNISVLVDTQKQDGSFEYWKKLIPEDFLPQLDSCIATLLEFQESGKLIIFTKDCCPSFRQSQDIGLKPWILQKVWDGLVVMMF
jgi:hypothetical protein